MSKRQKDSYYFSHDSNARKDLKIVKMLRVLGHSAYGLYWMIIEVLREQSDFSLPMDNLEDLAYEFRCDKELLGQIICDFDLFIIESGFFYSARLRRSMEKLDAKRKKLSEAGKAGNKIRWDQKQSPPDSDPIATRSPIDRIKEKENNESIIKDKKSKVKKAIAIVSDDSGQLINPFSESFLPAWREYLQFRADQHHFSYKNVAAQQKALDNLFQMASGDEERAKKIIDQSVINGWKGLFPTKGDGKGLKIDTGADKSPADFFNQWNNQSKTA